jgi:hypothetical protein
MKNYSKYLLIAGMLGNLGAFATDINNDDCVSSTSRTLRSYATTINQGIATEPLTNGSGRIVCAASLTIEGNENCVRIPQSTLNTAATALNSISSLLENFSNFRNRISR